MPGKSMRIVFLPRTTTYPGEQDYIVTRIPLDTTESGEPTVDVPCEVPPDGTPGIEVTLVSSTDRNSWPEIAGKA